MAKDHSLEVSEKSERKKTIDASGFSERLGKTIQNLSNWKSN